MKRRIFRVPNGKIIELTFTKFDVRLTYTIHNESISTFFFKDWVRIWLSDSGVGVMFHWILWREAGGIFGFSGNKEAVQCSFIIMSQITEKVRAISKLFKEKLLSNNFFPVDKNRCRQWKLSEVTFLYRWFCYKKVSCTYLSYLSFYRIIDKLESHVPSPSPPVLNP